MSYEHNIFWSDIPKNAQIYDLGGSWVVHMPDGRKGLVYWTGEDAGKAHAMLKIRALPKGAIPKETTSKPCCKWRWNGFPGDECVCGHSKSDHKSDTEIDADVAKFKEDHPEIYSGAPSSSCTIVCKFPRTRRR
jgi:hypothetical protein